MALNPAFSARCTRLSASSRSVGVYSWKKPGVEPNSAATSSKGSTVSVEATIGTPVRAAALAVARSPCPSWAHSPMTPIGAMNSGDGKVIPNSSTDRSRRAAPTNILGYSPQRSKADALARWVRSSPAPPATYDHREGPSAASARDASSSYVNGKRGTTPPSPSKKISFW